MSEAGKGVTREDLLELKGLLEQNALIRRDLELSSGIPSRYYFDAKRVTLETAGKILLPRVLEGIVRGYGAEAVGGLQIGAVPIADHILMPSFIVRDEKKGHGTKEKIAAAYSIRGAHSDLREGLRVAIVDDVVTTGKSILEAIRSVEASGAEVVVVLVLIRRPEGDADKKLGRYNYISLFESDNKGNLSLTAEAERLISSPVA